MRARLLLSDEARIGIKRVEGLDIEIVGKGIQKMGVVCVIYFVKYKLSFCVFTEKANIESHEPTYHLTRKILREASVNCDYTSLSSFPVTGGSRSIRKSGIGVPSYKNSYRFSVFSFQL